MKNDIYENLLYKADSHIFQVLKARIENTALVSCHIYTSPCMFILLRYTPARKLYFNLFYFDCYMTLPAECWYSTRELFINKCMYAAY